MSRQIYKLDDISHHIYGLSNNRYTNEKRTYSKIDTKTELKFNTSIEYTPELNHVSKINFNTSIQISGQMSGDMTPKMSRPPITPDSSPPYGLKKSPLKFLNKSDVFSRLFNHSPRSVSTVTCTPITSKSSTYNITPSTPNLKQNEPTSIYKFDFKSYNSIFFLKVLSINYIENNDIYLERRSEMIQDHNKSPLYNTVVNSNLTFFNMFSDQWKSTMERINIFRYFSVLENSIAKSKFNLIESLLYELKKVDCEILNNIVIYSGSALLLYGLTYTEDIDIVIFNMNPVQIRSVFNSINIKVDICFHYYNKFYKYDKNEMNINNLKIHHNNNIFQNMIGKIYKSNVLIRSNEFVVESSKPFFSNLVIENSIIVHGVRVFSIDQLDKFYLYRYELVNMDSKHYILLDLYYLRKYAKALRVITKYKYSSYDYNKFIAHLKDYNEIQDTSNTVMIDYLLNDVLQIQ